jgi:LDH2 family malate/lactate/ureidoglycolate dehydrogenase
MGDQTVFIGFETLSRLATDVLKCLNVPDEDAITCADVLIEANKRAIDSHGIARLKTYFYDRIKEGIQHPVTRFEVVRETPTTAVVDGHNGMGMVIAKRSMDVAIEKAKKYGIGMVAVRNSTHYGIAGYYVSMAINAGMIGVTGTNARPAVPPTFGVESMLGTNPLTFGIPSDEDFPFVLDCATSVVAVGKIEVYASLGKEIPSNWVIGADGNVRTDSSAILGDLRKGKAALAPLGGFGEESGGYKGYGYGTVVEILSAALQGGTFLKALSGIGADRKPQAIHNGHFFIAINVNAFTELETFKKTTGDILRSLRNSKRAVGKTRIYTAGEKEYLAYQTRRKTGLPIPLSLQKALRTMIHELNLRQYDSLFLDN